MINKFDDYIAKNALSQSASRGRSIFRNQLYTFQSFSTKEGGFAELKVKSENHGTQYKVIVTGFMSKQMISSCTCPYDWGGICKHRVAGIKAIQEKCDEEGIYEVNEIQKMDNSYLASYLLTDDNLKNNTNPIDWKLSHNAGKVHVLTAIDGEATTLVFSGNDTYKQTFKKTDKSTLLTTCNCQQELEYVLCSHKLVALQYLQKQYGIHAFNKMQDYDQIKNELLAPYGYTLSDNLKDKFHFQYMDNGAINLIVLDKSIHKIGGFQDWKKIHNFLKPNETEIFSPIIAEAEDTTRYYLYVVQQEKSSYPLDFLVRSFSYTLNSKGQMVNLKDLRQVYDAEELPLATPLDIEIQQNNKKMQLQALLRYLKDRKHHAPHYIQWSDLTPAAQADAHNYAAHYLDKLFPLLAQTQVCMADTEYLRSVKDLRMLHVVKEPIKPYLQLSEEDEFVTLMLCFQAPNEAEILSIENISAKYNGKWTFVWSDYLCRWSSPQDVALIAYFQGSQGKIRVKKDYVSGFLSDFVIPLSQDFDIEFNLSKEIEKKALTLKEMRVYLKENETHLFIVPAYIYEIEGEEFQFGNDGLSTKATFEDGAITLWERDWTAEAEELVFLRAQYADFEEQAHYANFSISFSDVLKDGWLFQFFDKMKEHNIPILGYANLKHLKYNPNRAKISVRASSGIDWFDMKMEISFGDQFISLNEVKKAILKKENYVRLGDGSMGILPQEWLDKFSAMFRIGQVKGGNIKVSKLHFSIIDELSEEIDSAEILQELWEKKQKLLNFKEIQGVPLPEKLTATLRHYQEEGYKWLNFLDEFGWGGCLADDMGLGKTLQILTFLQHQKSLYPDATNLIVMPTSLIFNWQAEVEKFAPELKIHVHRGLGRIKDADFFKEYDLILTTYGVVRSDVEMLSDFTFHYIVLDESQAIKNPDSLMSRAVKLLKAKNRLAMTGTPVENNTFDLYSQMEFLNPGLLGAVDFFKSEYAQPIDKNQDKEKAKELRKLVYPFMLKRTKEQVAQDLPDKTETIIYCEMGKKQRKVYDSFREKYRQQLSDSIQTQGMNKSSFLILEGLLKLRQICDSPALLSDDAEFDQESAKLEELIREIEENASNHKILIFSQFLGMLDLIRKHLETNHIPYEYLDGQTQDRAHRVNRFQKDESCRVFLMSLKAGGVGLNLTAADYVYLVDPWWNPAVERQAIDRTHRIGQTQKVFAYKMICKDTIEEKILQLQERKKELAEDLISTEVGFIKKLTSEDVLDLFS